MSNLADISYQKIEDSIMKVLINNEGSYFANNKLYSQVLNVLDLNTTFVDRSFKYKFMLVLKSLESKYDDVAFDTTNSTIIYGKQSTSKPIVETSPVNYTLPTPLELAAYIIDNNLLEYKQKTINHELVSGNYCTYVQKLIDNDEINYLLKDNEQQTVISRINSISMSNIFLEKLYKKIAFLQESNIDINLRLDEHLMIINSKLDKYIMNNNKRLEEQIDMNLQLERKMNTYQDKTIDYEIRIDMLEKDILNFYNNKNLPVYEYFKNKVYKFFDYMYIVEILMIVLIYKVFRYFIF
jgi:hypothetical protein